MTALKPPFRSAWRAVAGAVGIGAGTSLLDLGCGRGEFCAFAARRGASVHGLDVEPDAIAQALEKVPAGDFRLGMMESLPWAPESFDAVTALNSVQYALDPELALREAARVARPTGKIGVCKWGEAAENEFFAFLVSFGAGGVSGDQLPARDPVEDAVRATRLAVVLTADVPAPIEMADDASLIASLSRAGIMADPIAAPAPEAITAAAAPYRRTDGTYRFENQLRIWVLRRHR